MAGTIYPSNFLDCLRENSIKNYFMSNSHLYCSFSVLKLLQLQENALGLSQSKQFENSCSHCLEKIKKARADQPSSLSCALLTAPVLQMRCRTEPSVRLETVLYVCISMCRWRWDCSQEKRRSKSSWNPTLPSHE